MFGAGKAHFVEVKDNAKYKLLSKEAQQDALDSSERIASSGSGFDVGKCFSISSISYNICKWYYKKELWNVSSTLEPTMIILYQFQK
ncbi:MAG: hypothetical protein CM15mV19_1280 [uncultured marine virus]|nr:MAG: hypothetical protein CM15mV19_1280 [uncultured marine virus]